MAEEWIGVQDVLTSSDGMRIHYRRMTPSTATCFSVLLVHGLGEHAGRYNNFYHYMVPKGYEVFAPDLRGHGLSEGRRGHIYAFEDYLKDLDCLREVMKGSRPDKCGVGGGNILMGHSMGGLIALRYALDHQDEFDAVAVTGPALEIAVKVPAWKEALGKMMSKVFPTLSLPNGLDPDGLSRNPAVVKAYLDDPLVHDLVSARWFTEFVATIDYVQENAKNFRIPILIMHGDSDILAAPGGSRKFFENCGSEDKELKLYEGAYHELYNEINYNEVLDYLENWLKKRDL